MKKSLLCLSPLFLAWALNAESKSAPVYVVQERGSTLHEIVVQGVRSKIPAVKVQYLDELNDLPRCDSEIAAVIAVGKPALDSLLDLCKRTPVVFTLVNAPRYLELHKIPNVTGVTLDISLRYFFNEMRRFLKPRSRLGFIYSTDLNDFLLREADYIEGEYDFIVTRNKIGDLAGLGRALKQLIEKDKIAALWILPDPLFNAAIFRKISEICKANNVLLVSNFEALVKEAGAAFALAPDVFGVGAQAAEIVKQLEKGVSPSEIPFRTPQNTGVYLNLEIFRTFKIALPDDLRFREKVTSLNERGQKLAQEGKTAEALALFRKALGYDKKNAVAKYYMDSIRAKNAYATALAYLQKGDRIAALPFMAQAATMIAEARPKLSQLRNELKAHAGTVFESGVREFKNKKYNACLNAMNLVLLIDPGNNQAELYREKAARRAQAVKRLR